MLPARYHALRDRTFAQVDAVFAEPVRISFMKDAAVDPDRPMLEMEAVLRVGPGKQTSPAGNMVQSWQSRIAAQGGELRVDRAKYPSLVLRAGDRVKALARPGEPWFEVLLVDDRGGGRLVVQLGEV
jgi:hypothetical protein